MSYYLQKCLKLFVSQTRKLPRCLLLTVNVSSYGLVSILTSIVALQDPLRRLKSLFRVHTLLLKKNGKLAKMTTRCHSSFLVTRCHFLSLDVTRFHSLSFVVLLVVTHCHTLSLDVLLVCLFINDLKLFIQINVLSETKDK